MASAKKQVGFNDYMQYVLNEARGRGWGKTLFMHNCGIPRQRWSEFEKGRTLTGRYFLKIMEGLGPSIREVEGVKVAVKEIEKKSGRKMTPDQVREIQIESWQSAHRDIIEAMVDNPAIVDVVKAIIKANRKK